MARRSCENEDNTAHLDNTANFKLYDEGLQVVDEDNMPSKQCSNSEELEMTSSHQPCPGEFAEHDIPSKQYEYSDSEGLQVTPQPYPGKLTDPPLISEEKRNEGKEAVQMDPEYQASMEPCVRDRRVWVWILAAIITIIIVLCAVVIPVVVTRSNRQSTTPVSNNSSTPFDLSTSGAFNGSGLATMNPLNEENQIWVVWQDHTGTVALSRMTSGSWQSPQYLQLKNVINGTYLAAISYGVSNVTFYNIFYIDTLGTIQQSVMTNETNSWEPGFIGSMGWKASTSPMSSITATWNLVNFGVKHGSGGGLRLYAGGTDGVIHEYSFDQASDSWAEGFVFKGTNGAGGIGITQTGDVTNLHLLNAQNQLELWYNPQTNTSMNAYPAGGWVKGADAPTPIQHNSAAAACGTAVGLFFQSPQSQLLNIGLAGNGSAGTFLPAAAVSGVPAAMLGSRLACANFGNMTHLYFQSNGSDVVEAVLGNGTARAEVGWVPVG